MTVTHAPAIAAVPAGLVPPPPVLKVEGLSRRFGPGCSACPDLTGDRAATNRCLACGTVVAVRDAGFEVGGGEVLGIVGESGSGKTTLLRCLHLDIPVDTGRILVAGCGDLVSLVARSEVARRQLQSSVVVMVHQNALTAGLHPEMAAETNVAERRLTTGGRCFETIQREVTEILESMEVGRSRHTDPLHTFSGGMQQRVQLARALVDPPPVLLLDEPTTGLDPSVQAGLLETVQEAADRIAGATVVVSHDLGVVRVLASRVLVLHHGEIVEEGLTEQILEDPRHPYTQLLVSSRL